MRLFVFYLLCAKFTTMTEQVKPYGNSSSNKKDQVAEMFNNIAFKYDFLNHFLSLNIDKVWRKKVVNILKKTQPNTILDVATGTGDLAIASLKANPKHIYGIDISEGMLKVGVDKIKNKALESKISLQLGDAENIPFDNNYFNAVTVAFGARNFENLDKGLQEMHRVLSNEGKVIVLEFTMPTRFPIKQLYKFYFKYILPPLGKLFSKDSDAYTYLPQSVEEFPQNNAFIDHLQKAGFNNCEYKKLSFGIAAIYSGVK